MYNSVLGAGRDLRTVGTPVIRSIFDTSFDLNAGASPPTNTNTITIPSQTQIYAISSSVIQQKRDQTSTNARLRLTMNDQLIADYLLPTFNSNALPSEWVVNEIIPFIYLQIGEGNFVATLSADSGGTTGYIIEVRLSAIGVET